MGASRSQFGASGIRALGPLVALSSVLNTFPCDAAGTTPASSPALSSSGTAKTTTVPPLIPPTTAKSAQPVQAEPSLIAPASPATDTSSLLPRVDFSGVTSRLTALPNAISQPEASLLPPSIVLIVPTLSLSQAVTDNVNQTATGKQIDAFTTLEIASTAAIKTNRLTFTGAGTLDYTKYVETPTLDGYLVNSSATAVAEILKNLLFVQADISAVNLSTTVADQAAVARPTSGNLSLVSDYDVSPYVTHTFANTIDALLRARYAELSLDNAAATGINNARFNQAGAVLTTANHFRMYRMDVTGEYLKDNHGFVSQSALYSMFIGRSDGIRLVGRGGYESVREPGITDINDPVWLAGIQLAGPWSVDVEYGSRYGGPAWYADVDVPLTTVLSLQGSYTKSLQTAQSRLQSSLNQFVGTSLATVSDFSINLEPLNGPANLALVAGTFIDEEAVGGFLWSRTPPSVDEQTRQVVLAGAGTSVSLTGGLSHRRFLNPVGEDRFATVDLEIKHTVNHRFATSVSFIASKDLLVLGGGTKNTSYLVRANAAYQLTHDVAATFTYAWVDNHPGDGTSAAEHVVQFTLSKTF